jgi:hypothetical protein
MTEATQPDDVYLDAASRLERVVDAQLAALDDIDSRAMALMRLVAALLGTVVSLLSVAAALGDGVPTPSPVVLAGVVLALLALVGTLLAAAATYLGSRVVPGVGPELAEELLADPVSDAAHLRRVVATYAEAIRANRAALAVNARRFRTTLLLFVTGLAYGTHAAVGFALGVGGVAAVLALVVVTLALGGVWWYVLAGDHLAEPTDVPGGEVVTTGDREAVAPYPLASIDRGTDE